MTAHVMSRLVAEMDKELDGVETGRFELSQGMRDSSECPVLSDLLKDVPRLMSEEPGRQDIEEVCDLGSDPSEEVLLGGHNPSEGASSNVEALR